MFRFLFGVVVGAVGMWAVRRTQGEEVLNQRLADMQERASAVLAESRRILEETRRELTAAVEAGRESIQAKASRIRHAAEDQQTPEQPGE